MRSREQWELELEEIETLCSPAAMADLWAEILAGLANVEDERLAALALKAQALAAEEKDPELSDHLETKIDLIVYGRLTPPSAAGG